MLKRNDSLRTNRNCYLNSNTVKYIVVHYTGYFAPIKNYCLSQMNNDLNGSAHDFVDDNEWYNSIEHRHGAWAVGDDNGYGRFPNGITNQNSLSIEMCCCNANLDVSAKTIENTAEIVAYYMKVYGVPIDRVVRHWDCSYKQCPRDMAGNNNANWNKFKTKVMGYYNGTTKQVEEEIDYKGENDMFNEEWYLFRYKDVASAVKKGSFKSGYAHYLAFGKKEKRQPIPPLPINFVESDYRELNKDVDEAIKKGTFTSGAEHWLKYGWRPNEKRKVCKNETDEQAKKRVKELEKQVKELEDKIEKAKKDLK